MLSALGNRLIMTTPVIRINPAVDAKAARDAYKREGFVQIADIFEPHVAEHMARMIETLTYDLAFQGEEDKPVLLTQEEIRQQGQQMGQRIRNLMDRTGDNYGFLYQSYPLITAYLTGRDAGHPIHRLTEWLNAEFTAFGAFITDDPRVAKADGQLTRYRPGDFIGLHDDVGSEDSHRLTAYTLGFTRRWRSDWGGQLLFHDNKGDVSRGFVPRFNTLTLFKVPQLHSVAVVAPYAKVHRHSVVGWLRDHTS